MDEEKYKARFLSYFANTILYASTRYFNAENRRKENELELNEDMVTPSSNNAFEDGVFDFFKEYQELIAILTPRQKDVLLLTYEGRTDNEIGILLRITAGTVRATRRDARNKIKKHREMEEE